MKDGIQTYEFKFKFNEKDAKKQLKAISSDVLQMIHDMDTASNKMKVFTNFVGYLEKLDGALNQFKVDHKNDFVNLFGDVDGQLAKSLESAFGLSPKQLGQLSDLRSRIDGAFANKANTEELRKIAQDINMLFDAIGRPAELDIDGLFSGRGNLNERIGALNNALYKFYLQYQLITNSIQNGLVSGGMKGFSGLSEDVQKEVQKLSDAYDELITMQQKLQKAQTDIDKIHTKNNKKVVEQYKIELNEESVSQLMTEFDLLNAQLESGDSSSKEYYENLLKMTDVILKLNSALKTIRDDKSLLTTFQGISVGGGYGHMFDKLSKYTTQKATQFENNFLGKKLTEGLEKLMLERRVQIEKLFLGNTGKVVGGGNGNGDGGPQVSLYKQLVHDLKDYAKEYKKLKELEQDEDKYDEWEEKGEQVDSLKDKILQLVDLSEDASNAASEIFGVYENGKYSFEQLIDELTKVLGITKEIDEGGNGKKLKTYEELLKIVDQLNVGLDIGDDGNIQKLINDLKELYAAEEQLDDVDDILSNLIDGSIYDTDALSQLAKLFGVEIPDSVQTAAQKCEDFFNQVNRQKEIGLNDEFDAGQYLSKMEQLKNELQVLHDQGRLTDNNFSQIQKTFDKNVKSYVDEIINRSSVLKELNKLNQDATLTGDKEALETIVQKRREILAAAEQNGILLEQQLIEERAITDEIEKRIGLQKQDGQGGGQGSGSGGSGTGTGEGSGGSGGDAADENEQYQKLLETIKLVTDAVNEKTAAFVTEKNTVDDAVEQEIEALERLSDYLDTIKTTAQSVFGEKQGIVNSSVKEWQQSLESIYNTMQSISNMQSVEEMLARMAANAQGIKDSAGSSADSTQFTHAGTSAETVTKVDFTSLESTIKTEIASLVSKLDNVLKVEVVKSDAEEIKSAIGGVQKSIDSIVTTINDYKAKNANSQQQAQIDAMKNNLLQLQKFVSNFNEREVDGNYQQQEITGAILSDGSISVGYGEKGEVPWDRVASSLVANLTKALVVDLHSHPLKQLTNGQMYANDAFSGSKGDLSAFSFSKELGAKLAAEITGNVMRVLDLSKLSTTQMMSLSDRLRHIERDYAKKPEYSKYLVYEDDKIKYKQQSTLQGQHQVTQILESMMYEAFKGMGYSKEKVDKELFKKYDLTDDKQLTELASKLVQLSSASQTAIEPLERLKNIVSLFGGNLGSSEAKTAFEAFTKGELSAADVFNQLNGKGHKISQETIDSLFRIDSANEIPAVESMLNQVTSILNAISSSVSSIDGKIKTNVGQQFDYALNDMMEFSGLNDLGTKITDRLMSSVESHFDKFNVSEYKVNELAADAFRKAQDFNKNLEYVSRKDGQISVGETQAMLDSFTSTLRAMSDAISQEELYRERTGKKVLNDTGGSIEDDLITTFYAAFNKNTIQIMKDVLARGKEKWQAKKDSYGDGLDAKVDPVAQNIDSLTAAIGELQTVVSGLQQYITSPQFAIKADTSTLEESLVNVSTEINTGAQRIADAVNDFDHKVNDHNDLGQVSVDKSEISMAIKEAMYAKEFASNYEKAQWGDIFESHWDWGLDQSEYINKLTGEVFSTFEEADEHFDKYFSNFYKSLDESFIGTKEAAFDDLIKNLPDNDDFATVIVQAIQDQTGKIVNAIKVVLPESISSSASTNGAIANEEQIESAFQYIAKRASKWSDMNDRDPRDFFNSILRRNGNVQIDRRLEDALHTLGMLSPSGKPTFKVAQEGLRNLGVAIAEDFALPSRPIELNQVSELMPLLNEAAKLGAAIPRIVSSFTDVDRVFELQTKMKGSNIASSFDWLSATTEQIDGFIHTLEVLNKVGLYPDFIGDNVLFDKNKGFSLVDIETQPLKFGLDSAEDMGRWFVKYLTKMDWDGRDYEFQNFIDLFSERLALPSDQRLVNENTIPKQKNTAVINETANMSGLDEAIGKIVQAANAIEVFVSNFGNAVSSLMNQMPIGANANIELYDPNDYQDIKIYGPTDGNYDQNNFGNVNEELTDLQRLTSEVDLIEQAVRSKTAAFEEEGTAVHQVVESEIAVLKELSDVLNTIQTALQAIFGGNVYNFGNLDLMPEKINGNHEASVFQEIQQTLGQILAVLQGFTGLESDGENSIKHKEPVVDNNARTFDISEKLASKLNEIATEGTLVAIKDAVNQLADAIKVKDGSEPDHNNNDINSALNTLVSALSANVTSLKEVMDGVVTHQKTQKSDTKKAMARIQDPKQNQIISGLAKSAVDSLGDEAEVESLQALANGLIKVEGAFKNAEGQWEGFTVKINEHNEAVDLAVKKHSSFARLLNKGMPIEDDNPFVFSKDEVEKRAQKHLEEYAAQGKNATVQFKDSGRYTITILEEIDGLSKQIFQTFDENDKKIERTTVTMSNSQKTRLDNLQKKLIEKGLANNLISDKDNEYNAYKAAAEALSEMTSKYSKLDNISDEAIENWKQQITLVQQLGSQVEALIKKRKAAKGVGGGSTKKGQAFGLSQLQNFTARYNSLLSDASSIGLDDQAPEVLNLVNAYKQLQAAQSAFVAGEDKTTDVYAKKVEVFKAAQFECNKYARELNKVIASDKKLEAESVASNPLSEDFEDNMPGRTAALKDFVNALYGANASVDKFDAACNELYFTVNNGDGTFTKMTATINKARTAIYATAGATGELKSGFGAFISSVVGKFKSIIPYLTASFGWQEIWQQIRQGIEYVREIDSALTELKKVTNETDATYDRFLQSMSKTAGVVGSTVSELTTMASEWARLGYSMEEAGKLAESTAILLNVSEFQDATAASEALISTMQAFQYTADESGHVVDILNEIGNNYAISSDGIAIALQDSASALMEAGNNLEQSVALVAAANKVVQDPNSVGSALRTISLRLRGTSVKVLEEMGEETDGIVESVSKMQEKIKALTGVDILTESGAYKETYEILKEIGVVWEDMSDIDQAALLELMAGKNRANTLAAILGNMKDLEGAYESALNAEGSALKENAAYLDSIQGRIDLFKNSLQTLWMNFIDSSVVKFIVDIGTGLLKAADAVGVLSTAAGGFVGIKAIINSVKSDLESLNKSGTFDDNIFEKFSKESAIAKNATEEMQNALAKENEALKNNKDAKQEVVDATAENIAKKQVENGITTQNAGATGVENVQKDINTKKTWGQVAAEKALIGVKGLAKGLLIGAAVSLATTAITSIVSAIFEAAQRMDKLTDSAIKSAEKTQEVQDSISDYKEEVVSLRAELDSNNLSETEAYNARQRLIEIQNELIDKFGLEAKGLNLVTGAINDQAAAIDKLSQQSAQDWMKENMEAYRNAKNNMAKTYDSNNKLLLFGQQSSSMGATGTLANVSPDVINAYKDGLRRIVEDEYGGTLSESISASVDNLGNTIEFDNIHASFKDKTVEELDEIFSAIQTYLLDFDNNNDGIDLSSEIIRVQNLRNKYVDEDYKKSRELYESGRQQEAIANYAKEYGDILDAEEKIYNSKSDEEKLEAIKKYNDAIQKAKDAKTDDPHMDDYFDKIGEKFEEQEFELQVKLDENGLKSNIEEIINSGGESGLSVLDDVAIQDMVSRGLNVEGATDSSGKYTQEQINGLIALQSEADNAGISIESLISILTRLGIVAGQPIEQSAESVKIVTQAYSTLAESVESYHTVLSQTSEIVSDNTAVTQEYKDSLKELGISEEELSECFDDNNKLVVKNAALLRKLVAQKQKEQKATIQTAKSMSQLQYKNAVDQLQHFIKAMALEVKANGLVSDSTQNTIDVLHLQLTALQQTIQQYALLEMQLTNAANAYREFEAAKERDAQLIYGDSMVDALGVINEGFKTGQVGTESFQAAVKIVVPESEYAHIDDVEKRMIAIHDYIDKNPLFADWFTIDEGEFSITLDNINNFVDDANLAGIFTNDSSGDFFLTDEIRDAEDPLNEIAKKFNETFGTEVTEGSVLAMLTELEKYDASWGNIITDLTTTPLDRKINEATDALDKALTAQEEFILSGGDLDGEEYKKLCDAVDAANKKLVEATEAAENNTKTTTQVETVYAALLGKVQLTQEAADALAKSLGLVGENGEVPITVNDDGSISITNDALQKLKEKKDALEKTSVMDIQLRYDTITTQIEELQKYVDENLNFEDSEIAVSFGIKNKDEAEAKIAELTAEQKTISLNYDITSTTSELQSSVIEQLSTWETNGVTISIGANAEDARAVMEEFDKEMPEDKTAFVYGDGTDAYREFNNLDSKEFKEKDVPVTIPDIDLRIDEIEDLDKALRSLPGKITITVTKSDNLGGPGGVNGTAHVNGSAYKGGSWGAPKTETALVGELGPEMLVRGNRWTTIGENGAEFTQIKKGDIIFNHKQTEDLLSKGYITGRGKAYASGTANKSGTAYYRTFDGYYGSGDVFENGSDKWKDPHSNLDNAADSLSKAADDISDSAEEFKEIFDWIEVRIEEITDDLDLKGAKLENAVGSSSQNSIIDAMIKTNEDLYDNLLAGANKYYNYASKLLEKVPAEYRDAAQNGAIAIEEFVGKVDEKTLEAIKEYREWVQKGDDLTQQAEETLTEIAALAKQAFDNIVAEYDNKKSIGDSKIDQFDAYNAYAETAIGSESAAIYEAMIKENNANIAILEKQRNDMQAELNKRVESGEIEKYSQAWYDAVNEISAVDTEIIKLKTDTEDYQDAINELHWEHFDNLIGRLEAVSEEAQNLIDILGEKDAFDEAGNWTDEGITSLGLYAQQMENAEAQAKKYEEEIDYLNKNWQALGYTEEEYIAKLNELKDGQYDAIKAYHDSKKAIADLTKERVEAIKEGIEKEIDAYDELINKKKEALDAEKDAYDFQKSITEQQKNISDIERQIAALSADDSASARAKRAKLEAELAEERAKLDDMYYDRSVENQKKALDEEAENFRDTKNEEINSWDEYLKNTEKVVADSLAVVQENTKTVYKTIDEMGKEYSLSISSSITSPWKDGEAAIQSFSEKFGLSMSATVEELAKVSEKYKAFVDEIEGYGKNAVDQANKNAETYQEADKKQPSSSSNSASNTGKDNGASKESKTIRVGGKIHAGNAKIYDSVGDKSGRKQYYSSDPIYQVLAINGNWVQVRHKSLKSGVTGWFKKSDINAYASGTTGTLEDQLAIIDELGEELVIRPQNGKLTYMTKGTGVVPADLTENLMGWGAIDPSTMLERSKPQISASPSVVNNTSELKIDASVGTLLHVEHLDGSNPAEITKIVDKAWDKRMKELNGFVRKYSR